MRKLYRCRWNRKIFGVFGGLGQVLRIDPTVLRLLAVFLTIPTGIVVIPALYFLAGILMPEGPKHFIQPNYKKLYRSFRRKVIGGICQGVSSYLSIDVTIIRIAFIVGFFLTGGFPMIVTYAVGMWLIPLNPYE